MVTRRCGVVHAQRLRFRVYRGLAVKFLFESKCSFRRCDVISETWHWSGFVVRTDPHVRVDSVCILLGVGM